MIKTYSQALDYIYSFVDYSITRNLRYSPEKFNLKRMEDFLELIGNPHKNFKVIHVAGTKGKGSTCAMLASIFTNNNNKTGFYSSPHLIDFTERIRIGKNQISQKEIVEYVNKLKPQIEKVPALTTFEIITGLAFKYFSDRQIELGVIEVGMGGRFDATNVVKPQVSIITPISHDHTMVLGNTLKKIAFEKAGIIKNGIPVIVSKQKANALEVIDKIANERKARMIYAPDQFEIESQTFSLEGQNFTLRKNGNKLIDIFLPLLGDHQVDNAVTAFACIEELKSQGFNISSVAIKSGYKNVSWPGRFEIINKKPLIIIDGAHNLDSFRKLKETIRKYLPKKQILMIFGASEDKDIESMLKVIQPLIKTLIITKSEHPRAMELKKIKDISDKLEIPSILETNIKNAIGEALVNSDDSTAVLATGSIFIAGAVKVNFKG